MKLHCCVLFSLHDEKNKNKIKTHSILIRIEMSHSHDIAALLWFLGADTNITKRKMKPISSSTVLTLNSY